MYEASSGSHLQKPCAADRGPAERRTFAATISDDKPRAYVCDSRLKWSLPNHGFQSWAASAHTERRASDAVAGR